MLRGRFGGTTGRPYIEGRVYFPRLRLHGDVSFLIDTGADRSLLSPTDAFQVRIDFGVITRTSEAQGIGGVVRSFVEPAVLTFNEPGVGVWAYREDPEILPRDEAAPDADYAVSDPEQSLKLPSLLGREILDRWRMVYHPANGELTFDVISADGHLDRRSPEPI